MAYKAKSTKRRYEELLKAPLLFYCYKQKSGFDDYGMRYSYSGWFSCDSTIDLYISEDELKKMIRKESFSLSESRFSKMERLT